MALAIPLEEVRPEDTGAVGGKAAALARLVEREVVVPRALCIPVAAYEGYMAETGLKLRLGRELQRKPFEDMRWEELWDAALRIRNLFLSTALPPGLHADLSSVISRYFGNGAVVIRSSAPGEDTAKTSFAGLHESFVNVRGTDSILDHVRLVWASLWSDRALLYRQELGLDVASSAMAVLVQELILSERSGVAFSQSPANPLEAVIEAVYGLNQGLVDGTVQPDRWTLDRETGRVLAHEACDRASVVQASADGVRLEALPNEKAVRPPLDDTDIGRVYELTRSLEQLFGRPQDVEWTFCSDRLYTLQSRPITARTDADDQRQWYLTLTRSFENLRELRARIEGELIPEMQRVAVELSRQNLTALSDEELVVELDRRRQIERYWTDVYWADFIPFAHGIRLFGLVYNDAVRPGDPHEFMQLLGSTPMESLQRNAMLEDLAGMIRENEELAARLLRGEAYGEDGEFAGALDAFLNRFGDMAWHDQGVFREREPLVRLLLELAKRGPTATRTGSEDARVLQERFLSQFSGERLAFAEELLDLARVSYQLRDDDNIYLGRIEAQCLAAEAEGRRRLESGATPNRVLAEALERGAAEQELDHGADRPDDASDPSGRWRLRPRQLLGQPAGPGVADGPARVVSDPRDLFEFKRGEILVCDAIDPNMTLVVPLAAAIVERRGGMLIHGAIIAREYGLPCVTGVPAATSRIQTGDQLTVDGHLGIVVCKAREQVEKGGLS